MIEKRQIWREYPRGLPFLIAFLNLGQFLMLSERTYDKIE